MTENRRINAMKLSRQTILLVLAEAVLAVCSGVLLGREEYFTASLLFVLQGIWAAVFYLRVIRIMYNAEREVKEMIRELGLRDLSMFRKILLDLVHRQDTFTEKTFTLQMLKKQAELNALQSQINPHFLYNTLDSIRGYALRKDMDEIADMTEALSSYFRYSISGKESIVTVGDELENIENYMLIQKFRFGDRAELYTELEDPALEDCAIPRMTLQPVVENAVLHGLESSSRKGIVKVHIRAVYQDLEIRVQDNGIGMDDETLRELNERLTHPDRQEVRDGKHTGIALPNVCERIRLNYGEAYGIHAFSTRGAGTEMLIRMPVRKLA